MSTITLEREIKLRFPSADEAREAILRPAPHRCTDGGCRKTRFSTPTMRSCGAGDASCESGWRTARAV